MIAVVPLADAAATFAWAGCALLAGVYLTREVCPSRPPALAVVPLAAGATAEPWPAPVGAPLSIDPPTTQPPTEEAAMPEIPAEMQTDTEVGDLVNTAENPVLDLTDHEEIEVVVDIRSARRPDGAHAIRVAWPNRPLTAYEAHRLHLDLQIAADTVANIRRDLGYES